jgi:hypothetical protein
MVLFPAIAVQAEPDAGELVRKSFDHYRGLASKARIEMIIHRPAWERRMEMDAWTQGNRNSLVRIIAPAKDKGNATLKKGREMYIYNPKIDRVINLPPSMMSQSWMGSDFSNNDLSKTDALITDYIHTLEAIESHEGHKVHVIKSLPKPMAPVVWGMQQLKIRDDHVLLCQEFFDEDLQSVKKMTTEDIRMMGGRMFPGIWRMAETGVEDEFTELHYKDLYFLDNLPDRLFTLNELKSRRRR